MRVSIKKDTTGKLKDFIRRMPPNSKAMIELGLVAKNVITTRTHAGKDETGKKFDDYSKKPYYASIKNRPAGYPAPSGGRTTHKKYGTKLQSMAFDGGYGAYKVGIGRPAFPQLSVSGQMLRDIAVISPNPRQAVLFFKSKESAEKAHALHEGKYPFFGLVSSNRRELYLELARAVKATKKAVGM